MNSLRKLPYSVAFHSKIATFSHFMMNSFFLENPCTFLKQPKVWTFSEMLVFQLISTAKLLPPANFYNFQIFVRKTHFFYFKKAWSSNFLRAVTLSVDSMACLLPLLFLKTSVFLEKPKSSLIFPNPKSWMFWETLLIPSHCTAILLPSAIFENFQVFFGKNHLFLQKTQLLNVLINLTVPFAFNIKLANCFSRSRPQTG